MLLLLVIETVVAHGTSTSTTGRLLWVVVTVKILPSLYLYTQIQ